MLVQLSNIQEIVAGLMTERYLSLDTETTGLEETDRPFSFSIASHTHSYYFDSRIITTLWGRPDVRELIQRTDVRWIMMNPKFDRRMLSYMGLNLYGTVIDIQVAARLYRNDFMTYSLDAQAKRFGWSKIDEVKKWIKENKAYSKRRNCFGEEYQNMQFDMVPVDLMCTYACKDARLTFDLYWHKYLPLIQSNPGMTAVMNNEINLTNVCYAMERHGLYLDRQYTLEAMYHEQALVTQGKGKFLELTGAEYKNSAKHIGPLLGYELPKTEEGNPSLTDDVLETILVDGSPEAKEIAETVRLIRGSEKRISTYYRSYLEKAGPDNIIHPNMWPGGTRTGRFSYSDPNLQNLHKDKGSTEKYVVRGCFTPRPGNIFLSFDYEQMEYKMMAAYANDTRLIQAIMGGADFHQAMADMIGLERDTAKTLNFAILYGAGPKKIALMLGISMAEAERLKLKYFMAMPKVEELINRIIHKAKSTNQIHTWLGRPLHFGWRLDPKNGERFHDGYSAPNHLIQGGGADVVKVAMNRIAERYFQQDYPMVLQVHDQLVFDVPRERVTRELITGIQCIMEGAFPEKNGLRLTVEPSWSEKSLATRDFVKGFAA